MTTTPATRLDARRSRALQLHQEGRSVDAIASVLGLEVSTVGRYLRRPGARRGPRPKTWADPYPDYSDRPGPIYCTCGAPTPHEPMVKAGPRTARKNRVDGIPWGFCSRACYEAGFDRLESLLGGLR